MSRVRHRDGRPLSRPDDPTNTGRIFHLPGRRSNDRSKETGHRRGPWQCGRGNDSIDGRRISDGQCSTRIIAPATFSFFRLPQGRWCVNETDAIDLAESLCVFRRMIKLLAQHEILVKHPPGKPIAPNIYQCLKGHGNLIVQFEMEFSLENFIVNDE